MAICIHDTSAIDALVRKERLDRHQVHRLRVAFFKHALGRSESLTHLTGATCEWFADPERVQFHALKIDAQHQSLDDGATKVLFRTLEHGMPVESVILRNAGGRTTVCVSAQSGCALGCEFCATGYMGFRGHLSTAQILDQVAQCAETLRSEDQQIRNVVFMGMGEPFDNESAVTGAVESLIDPHQFGLDDRRVMVSTVGVPDAMRRFAAQFPKCGLALSLHSARSEILARLIPMTRRHPLPELRGVLLETSRVMRRAPMIEYLMLSGLTDSIDADLPALLRLLEGIDSHINLIPFNPIQRAEELLPSSRAQIEAFAHELRCQGRKVTIRRSLGIDIAAACGQLAQSSANHLESRPLPSIGVTGS